MLGQTAKKIEDKEISKDKEIPKDKEISKDKESLENKEISKDKESLENEEISKDKAMQNNETVGLLYDIYLDTHQQKEISIYRKHGAVNGLAESMAKLFCGIVSHPIGSLEERIEKAMRAKAHHLFQHLSFDMLLLGETEKAKGYMQDAVNNSAGMFWPYMRSIINNIGKVQEIIASSKDELNKAREKYNNLPLEYYLK